MSLLASLRSLFGGPRTHLVAERFDPLDTTGVLTGAVVLADDPYASGLRQAARASLELAGAERDMIRVDPFPRFLRVSAGAFHPDKWTTWARRLVAQGHAREVHLFFLSPLDDRDAVWSVDAGKLMTQHSGACFDAGGGWTGPVAKLLARLGSDLPRSALQPRPPARYEPVREADPALAPTRALVKLAEPGNTPQRLETLAHKSGLALAPGEAPGLLSGRRRSESEPADLQGFAAAASATDGVEAAALLLSDRTQRVEAAWVYRGGELVEHRAVRFADDVGLQRLLEQDAPSAEALRGHAWEHWPAGHLARALGVASRAALGALDADGLLPSPAGANQKTE